MKKAGNFLALIAIVFAVSLSFNASGQGRGHDKKGERKSQRNDRDDRRWNKRDHDYAYRGHDRHHHERRQVRHVYHHHHDRYCLHTPVVVHRYVRPRYIYYRDYDVYYDSRSSVYISWSGRSWTVSAGVPVVMQHVNARSTARFEVDYYEDNFPRYLETNRPTFSREYRDW